MVIGSKYLPISLRKCTQGTNRTLNLLREPDTQLTERAATTIVPNMKACGICDINADPVLFYALIQLI